MLRRISIKNTIKIAGISVGALILLFVIGIIILLRDGFSKLETKVYEIPKPAKIYTSWDEILANPAPVLVFAFNTGQMQMDRYPEGPETAVDRFKITDIPVTLIRHNIYGDFLIDTGYDSSFYKNPPFGNYPFIARTMLEMMGYNKISQKKGSDIINQIDNYKATPKIVFLTHLHPDHTAGIPSLSPEIKYVFGEKEINFLIKALLIDSHLKDIKKLETINFSEAQTILPLGLCIDLLGDGSIWAIDTHGHSESHISYLVNAEAGPVLITGDAAFYYWGFENNINAEMDSDKINASEARSRLLAFCKMYPQTRILLGHEFCE